MPRDVDEKKTRKALRKLRKTAERAKAEGIELTEWEQEFLDGVVRTRKNARLAATFHRLVAQADDGESGKTAKSERHIWILEHWDDVVPYHFSTDRDIPFGSWAI